MCNFLSGVTLATGDVSIGELVDSHEAIIEQAGWQNADKRTDGRMGLCRWEYTPTDGDWTKPLSEWVFRIDEYAIPEWWTPEHEATAISRAQAVLLRMLVLGGTHTVKTGRVFASGSATVRAYDSATVEAYGSATVRAYDSATVEAYGSATVEASGSATVEAYGSATVRASGSATVRAYDSATVRAYGSATVRAYDSATVRAYDSATVEASGSATVRASGSATVEAYGSATVRAYDSATVRAYDSATVNTVYGEPKVAVADSAIELDRRGDIVIVRGNCKLAKAQGDA